VQITDVVTGEIKTVELDGLFISIGRNPETGLFKDQLLLDDKGYVLADETTRTSLPGVFAVGDVRTKLVRQIVTACADGAVAAQMAEQMLIRE
jgi:thioredoxin reductase (NADPH)